MKIYVASSVANAQSIPFQNLIRWLDEKGIAITFRWWGSEVDVNDEESMRRQAAREFQAIHECDVYLMVLPGKMGAHVELGLALGMNKHVAIWRPCGYQHAGDYPCVFHYLNRVRRFDGSPIADVKDWIQCSS